jgi:hypothetical protein
VQLDDAVTASNSLVQAGREDFTFMIRGNGGNDAISVRVGEAGLVGGQENWYQAQKMNQELNIADRGGEGQIVIDGGDGNDTIRKPGSGDTTINLGAGNDTVYTDNTGSLTSANTVITNSGRAMWVYNTADQVLAGAPERDIDDLESDVNDVYFMYRAELTVTFRDVETQVPVVIGTLAGDRTVTDLHINQAIKAAINLDPVLSKVLVARDGPANVLIIQSLIDGDYDETDLSVDIELPDDLSATDVNALLNAWEDELDDRGFDADEPGLFDLMEDDLANWVADDDYDTQLANDAGATDLTGADSTVSTTDNIIEGSTGNDVIVLSTTFVDDDVDEDDDLLESSNETVVYSGAFGDDTIFNFTADGINDVDEQEVGDDDGVESNGEDVLDFTGIGGTDFTGTLDTEPDDGEIMIDDNFADDDSIDIDDVLALFDDQTTADFDAEYIYVEVQGSIGHVYRLTDTEDDEPEIELLGTIDLADTSWFDLDTSNFA